MPGLADDSREDARAEGGFQGRTARPVNHHTVEDQRCH